MKKLKFSLPRMITLPMADAAYLPDEENANRTDVLIEAAIQTLSTEIEITVSGVTAILAMWQDPEHWETDWAGKLDCDVDDVQEEVEDLLANAIDDG